MKAKYFHSIYFIKAKYFPVCNLRRLAANDVNYS